MVGDGTSPLALLANMALRGQLWPGPYLMAIEGTRKNGTRGKRVCESAVRNGPNTLDMLPRRVLSTTSVLRISLRMEEAIGPSRMLYLFS